MKYRTTKVENDVSQKEIINWIAFIWLYYKFLI